LPGAIAMASQVTRNTAIDELVNICPEVIGLLIEEGLPCVVCGEPFWGTLGELAASEGWNDAAIDRLVSKVQQCCVAD
jgi:hypothetical protein